jgi:group I intron endonuclease
MFQAYLITCSVTERRYVGITSRSLKRRWAEHVYDAGAGRTGMAIGRAIAKHGRESFRIEALCCASSWDDICTVERLLIVQHGTRRPHGYNLSEGGEGPFGARRTAESVERSASKHRGLPCHPNTRAAATRTHSGVAKSTEHKAKIGAANVGRTKSPEARARIAAYWADRRARGEFKTSRPYAHAAKSGRASSNNRTAA